MNNHLQNNPSNNLQNKHKDDIQLTKTIFTEIQILLLYIAQMETTIPTEQVSLEETVALFNQIKKLYESVKKAKSIGS